MVTFLDEESGRVSIGRQFNPKQIKFDVLEKQKESLGEAGNEIPIKRFEDLTKPTEIEPLEDKEKPKEEAATPKEEVKNDFKADKYIFEYLASLIHKGRKLRVLEFNLKAVNSQEEVDKLLEDASLTGQISPDEKEEMLSLERKRQREEAERKKALLAPLPSLGAAFEEAEKDFNLARDQHMVDLLAYMQSFRERKAKFARIMRDLNTDKHMPFPEEPKELLESRAAYVEARKKEKQAISLAHADAQTVVAYEKNEKKIFLEKISDKFTLLERKLVDSTKSRWEKDAPRQKNIAIGLMGALSFEFEDANIEDAPEIGLLIQNLSETASKLTKEEQERLHLGLFVFPLEFNAKELLVAKGAWDGSNANAIKIILGGKEIAAGELVPGGSKMEFNKAFKHGFLAEPTEEEQAFDRAMELVSRLKAV